MRFVLVLLAMIGLLASPVAAAAAQAACAGHGPEAMMGMPTTITGMSHGDGAKADPCCPDKDHGQPKHHDMSCAAACAVMGGVVAAMPSAPASLAIGSTAASPPPTRMASLQSHASSRLERPPRSIA